MGPNLRLVSWGFLVNPRQKKCGQPQKLTSFTHVHVAIILFNAFNTLFESAFTAFCVFLNNKKEEAVVVDFLLPRKTTLRKLIFHWFI